jgi:hypothetical protein
MTLQNKNGEKCQLNFNPNFSRQNCENKTEHLIYDNGIFSEVKKIKVCSNHYLILKGLLISEFIKKHLFAKFL